MYEISRKFKFGVGRHIVEAIAIDSAGNKCRGV